MFTQTTHSIKITALPTYLPHQSDPEDGVHTWAYLIKLDNYGDETVQLINRYWHITDANGHVQEVRGEGVIGEQPILLPKDQYHYASGVSLRAPSGIMRGHYEMEKENGERILIHIPAFSLDSDVQLSRAN